MGKNKNDFDDFRQDEYEYHCLDCGRKVRITIGVLIKDVVKGFENKKVRSRSRDFLFFMYGVALTSLLYWFW